MACMDAPPLPWPESPSPQSPGPWLTDRVILSLCSRAPESSLKVGLLPLVDITTFLESLPPAVGKTITFKSEDSDWPS
eukprot:3088813-Rhodomonas_salina.1